MCRNILLCIDVKIILSEFGESNSSSILSKREKLME